LFNTRYCYFEWPRVRVEKTVPEISGNDGRAEQADGRFHRSVREPRDGFPDRRVLRTHAIKRSIVNHFDSCVTGT